MGLYGGGVRLKEPANIAHGESNARVFGIDLQLVGFAFHLAWLYVLLYREFPFGAESFSAMGATTHSALSPFYLISAAALVLTLLPPLFSPLHAMRVFGKQRAIIAAGIVTAIGSFLYSAVALGGLQLIAFATVAGGVLTGIGSGVIATCWIRVFREKGAESILGSAPTVIAATLVLCITIPLTGIAQVGIISCLPIITCVFLVMHSPSREDAASVSRKSRPSRQRMLAGLMAAGIILFGIATGFLSCFNIEQSSFSYTFFLYLTATVALLIVCGISISKQGGGTFAVGFICPIAITACTLIMMSAFEGSNFAIAASSVSVIFLEMLLVVLIALCAQWQSLSAVRTFAAYRIAYAVIDFLARALTQYFLAHQESTLMLQSVGSTLFLGVELLVAACIAIMFVVSKAARTGSAAGDAPNDTSKTRPVALGANARASSAPSEPSASSNALDGRSAAEQAPLPEGRFKARLERFSREHDLSPREKDVTELLVKGFTAARIQEELHIAAGTVNYHTRNIYQKCGVHTKQDLISLFDSKTHQTADPEDSRS